MVNLDRMPAAAALTGAIRRGDAGTVAAHLAALAPRDRRVYAALGLEALTLARAAGLAEGPAAELERPAGGRGYWSMTFTPFGGVKVKVPGGSAALVRNCERVRVRWLPDGSVTSMRRGRRVAPREPERGGGERQPLDDRRQLQHIHRRAGHLSRAARVTLYRSVGLSSSHARRLAPYPDARAIGSPQHLAGRRAGRVDPDGGAVDHDGLPGGSVKRIESRDAPACARVPRLLNVPIISLLTTCSKSAVNELSCR